MRNRNRETSRIMNSFGPDNHPDYRKVRRLLRSIGKRKIEYNDVYRILVVLKKNLNLK